MTAVTGWASDRIARRIIFCPVLGIGAVGRPICHEPGVEKLSTNQLVIAMQSRVESLTRNAAAQPPCRRRSIDQTATAEGRRTARHDAVSIRWTLGPNPAIDDTNDDVFARDEPATDRLGPKPTGCSQPQKIRSRNGLKPARLIRVHLDHQRAGPQRLHFSVRQAGRKTVVDRAVARHDGRIAHQSRHTELL